MSFPPLANDTFLRACLRQATPYTPLWLMRQAGRYLPEYKATRARAGSFMGLATNVQYATEVTLQPLDRFALDAAIRGSFHATARLRGGSALGRASVHVALRGSQLRARRDDEVMWPHG